jgi:CRISPR-associated exonuclease Cas4
MIERKETSMSENSPNYENRYEADTKNGNQELLHLGGMERITGTQVAYYFLCHRKLWLFSNHITFEHENENVKIGKQVNQEAYSRERKEVNVDQTISIDFIKGKNGAVVHEIKKSNKMEESHTWQLLYYLYYLKAKRVFATGVINYPLLNKKVEITLDLKAENIIERTLADIRHLLSGKLPSPVMMSICKKCAYFEFCYGDEL